MKDLDLVGIGAINVDFIASASSGVGEPPEYGGVAEFGIETVKSDKYLDDALSHIDQNKLHADPGGSALNVLHAVAHLDLGISLGMIGVAGRSPTREVDFTTFFANHNIDEQFVEHVDELAGRCLSFVNDGERTMFTTSGANHNAPNFILQHKDELVEYLATARITHLTSLLDPSAPHLMKEVMEAVRERNPLCLLSFDPGFTWCQAITDPQMELGIEGLLELCSLLFVNHREFQLLGDYRPGDTDSEVAQRLFDRCSQSCELIVLKRYDGVDLFRNATGVVTAKSLRRAPIAIPIIQDATGAGDVFAAGVLAAVVSPSLHGPLGVAIGLNFARHKLQHVGTTGHSGLSRIATHVTTRALNLAADERTIVTFVFIDMVASTARTQRTGDSAARMTKEATKEAILAALEEWHGELHKEIGDGFLLLFDTPGSALECTRQIRASLGTTIRIGLHTGPYLVEQNGELTGLAINAASRIQALAKPGQILLSRCTRDLVADGTYLLPLAMRTELKGFQEEWDLHELD